MKKVYTKEQIELLAKHMSLNQYKKFCQENKEEILKADNTCFKAIDLAKKIL